MRSEIAPQIWRLRKAVPSSTDSIAAPTARLMPRSPQKAMRWPCGIAIGMQHSTAAPQIMTKTMFGLRPSTRSCAVPARDVVAGWTTSGG
jgi:hypothetical protein